MPNIQFYDIAVKSLSFLYQLKINIRPCRQYYRPYAFHSLSVLSFLLFMVTSTLISLAVSMEAFDLTVDPFFLSAFHIVHAIPSSLALFAYSKNNPLGSHYDFSIFLHLQ